MTGCTWPATDAPLPSISKDDAEELFAELVGRYQDPLFQISLTKLFCHVNPRQKDYTSQLSNLLRPVRDDLLAKYDLPTGFLGDVALALALGDLRDDADLDYLLAQIDESLYSSEPHIISGSETLKKKEVIQALRMMVFAFRNPDFHRTMISLKAASMVTGKSMGYSLDGRLKLALEKQRPILAKFNLPPNRRGLHMFLHMVAQYIMDPDVAALIAAANTLCGLDAEECKEFNTRLQDISLHDPCAGAVDPNATTKARLRAQEAAALASEPPKRRPYAGWHLRPRLLASGGNFEPVPDTNVYGDYQYSTDTNRRTGTLSVRSTKLEIAMSGDDSKFAGLSQVCGDGAGQVGLFANFSLECLDKLNTEDVLGDDETTGGDSKSTETSD